MCCSDNYGDFFEGNSENNWSFVRLNRFNLVILRLYRA
jgi:hypothetical protein